MGNLSKLGVRMVRTNSTELGHGPTPSLTFHDSHLVLTLRNDADRARMREQVPTHRVWDGSRFLCGDTPQKPFHVFTGSSQTT